MYTAWQNCLLEVVSGELASAAAPRKFYRGTETLNSCIVGRASCSGIKGSAAKSVGKRGFFRVGTMDLPTLFEEISSNGADLAGTNKLLNSVPSLVKFPWAAQRREP